MYKIYREGNYIRVIDVRTNELFNGAIKEVFVDKSNVQKNEYTISKVKDFNELEVLRIGSILKQDNTAYSTSEWETFYTENTGNFNGGGAAPEISENKVSVYTVDGTGVKYYSSDYVNEIADTKLDKSGGTLTGAITATNLSGTNTGDLSENYVYLSHEFLTANPSSDFSLAQINSGTISAGVSTINNVGVHRMNSSTTANSGIAIRSASFLFRLKGNEVFTYILNPLTFTNTTSRLGFHDTTTHTIPNNGVYFEYSNSGALTFVTVDNNVRTTSASLGTLVVSTWYKVKFTVNANATSILAELFNSSGVLIASVTQTTNIPNNTRALNICAITTNSGTVATALIDVDYIGTKLTLIR